MRGYLDYLLGTRRELQPVWREYGFAPQTDDAGAQLLRGAAGRRGRQRVGFPVQFLTPEALAHDIELLLRAAGGVTADAPAQLLS